MLTACQTKCAKAFDAYRTEPSPLPCVAEGRLGLMVRHVHHNDTIGSDSRRL